MTTSKVIAYDKSEILNDGTVFVRFKKKVLVDGQEFFSDWHRTAIPPGQDITLQLDAVDADLAQPERGGYAPMSADDRAKIAALVALVQTPDVITAYKAANQGPVTENMEPEE